MWQLESSPAGAPEVADAVEAFFSDSVASDTPAWSTLEAIGALQLEPLNARLYSSLALPNANADAERLERLRELLLPRSPQAVAPAPAEQAVRTKATPKLRAGDEPAHASDTSAEGRAGVRLPAVGVNLRNRNVRPAHAAMAAHPGDGSRLPAAPNKPIRRVRDGVGAISLDGAMPLLPCRPAAHVASLDEAQMSESCQRREGAPMTIRTDGSECASDSPHQRVKRHRPTRPPVGAGSPGALAQPNSGTEDGGDGGLLCGPEHGVTADVHAAQAQHQPRAVDSEALARLTERRLAEIDAAKQRRVQRLARKADEDRARVANDGRLREITRRAREGSKGMSEPRATAAAELRKEAEACALGVIEHIVALSVGSGSLRALGDEVLRVLEYADCPWMYRFLYRLHSVC